MKKDNDFEYVLLNDEKNYYSTSDLGIATTLAVKNYELVSVDSHDNRKAIFIFRRKNGLDDVVSKFWTNSIDVCPLEFLNTLKNLKSRIYGMKTITY